jgi:hypothetical protein
VSAGDANIANPAANTAPEAFAPTDGCTIQGDQRVTRTHWPKDPAKRLEAIAKVMPEAIRDYFGNVVVIASALSLTPREVNNAIALDPALKEAQDIATNAVAALLEDRLLYLAMNSTNAATVRFMLERRSPERWAAKDKVTKSKALEFDVPSAPPTSVLQGGNPSEVSEAE